MTELLILRPGSQEMEFRDVPSFIILLSFYTFQSLSRKVIFVTQS